jgi:tetratricopeptide (TPR) repeat protein
VTGRPDHALAEQAVADSEALDADHRIRALTARWATLWTPRYARDRLAIAHEVVGLSGRHVQRQLAARHLLTTALLEMGDLAASDAEFALLADAIDRQRDPDFALLAVWWRAMRALMAGDLAGAEATAADLQARLAGASGRAAGTATLSMGTVSGIVAWERGLLGHAAAQLDAQGFTEHPGMQAVRALAHAQNGDVDTAHRILDEAFGPDLNDLGDDPMSISPLVLATEALAVAGDGGQAAALLERLAPHSDAVIVFAPGAVCMGAGTLYTGTAAALSGDMERARADLEDAAARNDALGAAPFTVRSLVRLALVLDRTGDAVGAARRTADAADLAARHGLTVAPFAAK